jgi:ferredoxin
MAGGMNARKTQGERVRHRILDKLDYEHGCVTSCVGCGRCVRVCPANIADPVHALNLLKEEAVHE